MDCVRVRYVVAVVGALGVVAMPNRPTFTDGEVVNHLKLNQMSMQAIQVFASRAERDAAYGSAGVARGEISLMCDANCLEVWKGTSWEPLWDEVGEILPVGRLRQFGPIPDRLAVASDGGCWTRAQIERGRDAGTW